MTAWIVRAGVAGERDAWALDGGLAGGGFTEAPDLTDYVTQPQVAAVAADVYEGEPPGMVSNAAGQLWALRGRIQPGDLIVLPLKSTKKVALGTCTQGYRYLEHEPVDRRHSITVDWKRTDIPRSAFKDDLLNTINGAMTVFRATRNDAEARLNHMLAPESTDPGTGNSTLGTGSEVNLAQETTENPEPAITLEAIRDRVRIHLAENFSGHKLTHLVAAILTAQGYTCTVSPEGPDFGVDILAGRGPLGLDSPTLVVEVKSGSSPIGVQILNQLIGAVASHRADQALLVAWGGLNKQAEQLRMTQRLKVAVWNDEDILDRLFSNYTGLPEDMRQAIPLKQGWVLVEETG